LKINKALKQINRAATAILSSRKTAIVKGELIMSTLPVHVQCPKCPNTLINHTNEFKNGDRYTCPFCVTPIKIKIINGTVVGELFAEGEEIPAE
jgi:Zn finger protein HypA/HybF involved in hydrogenase expression